MRPRGRSGGLTLIALYDRCNDLMIDRSAALGWDDATANGFCFRFLYPSSMRAEFGDVFACASMAADACTKILYFAKLVLSSAMSTSMMRPFAASRLA